MKTIFIKDDRLRDIIEYRNEEIVKLMLNGELESSYIIKQSTKEFEDGIYFGWDIEVSDDNWKIKKSLI